MDTGIFLNFQLFVSFQTSLFPLLLLHYLHLVLTLQFMFYFQEFFSVHFFRLFCFVSEISGYCFGIRRKRRMLCNLCARVCCMHVYFMFLIIRKSICLSGKRMCAAFARSHSRVNETMNENFSTVSQEKKKKRQKKCCICCVRVFNISSSEAIAKIPNISFISWPISPVAYPPLSLGFSFSALR